MNPEQQQQANLIISMGMETEADAGDFASIATAAHAQSNVTPRADKVGGKESLSALLAAGYDATAIVSAMRSDALGNEVMDTLIVSGVDWNDDLTKTILSGLVSQGEVITQAVADTLINLSITKSSPAQGAGVPDDTTALDFEIAWSAKQAADVEAANQETAARKAGAVGEAAAQVIATIEADHTATLESVTAALTAALATEWGAI